MKKMFRSMQGVTLLEIMLVLAIAAMIIVMSIRYYQSATSAQQSNTALNTVQSIVAAMDSLAQASGSYAGLSATSIAPLLPKDGMNLPWGTTITLNDVNSNKYTMSLPGTPGAVCGLLVSKLTSNDHFTTSACSEKGSTTDLSVTYTANA